MNASQTDDELMPAVFHHPLRVRAEDADELGHANNLVYLRWAVSAAVAHTAAQGWPTSRYLGLQMGWVVRRHEIEYRKPAVPGDLILVRTWVAEMHKATSLRRYRIVRFDAAANSAVEADGGAGAPGTPGVTGSEVLLATAATDWAFIDYRTGAARRIPPEVLADFTAVTEPPAPLNAWPVDCRLPSG